MPQQMRTMMRDLCESGDVSALAAVVGDADSIRESVTGGRRAASRAGRPSIGSLFDLASLAKPFTATLALALDASGDLPLATPLGELWPHADRTLAATALADLLTHRGRLIAWTPLYQRLEDRSELIDLLLSGSLLGARRGTYSDLGYILWAKTAERALDEPLWELLRRHVVQPLGLGRQVVNAPGDSPRVVECTLDTTRETELAAEQGFKLHFGSPGIGKPQDGNARWLGGYCGHAGLFGSARALWRLGAEWLSPSVLDRDLTRRALTGRTRYALGWWRRTKAGSAGPALSPAAFGHTGFTGGSIWIDPGQQRIWVLLAHRKSSRVTLDPWRRRFHACLPRL